MGDMIETFCPATMCHLIAPNGSPWTNHFNHKCDGPKCDWYGEEHCTASDMAHEQAIRALNNEPIPVLGKITPKRYEARQSKDYMCQRTRECQWHIEAEKEGGICPPITALRLGLDPKVCLY